MWFYHWKVHKRHIVFSEFLSENVHCLNSTDILMIIFLFLFSCLCDGKLSFLSWLKLTVHLTTNFTSHFSVKVIRFIDYKNVTLVEVIFRHV